MWVKATWQSPNFQAVPCTDKLGGGTLWTVGPGLGLNKTATMLRSGCYIEPQVSITSNKLSFFAETWLKDWSHHLIRLFRSGTLHANCSTRILQQSSRWQARGIVQGATKGLLLVQTLV